MTKSISIKSFNPFEYKFPNRKVLTINEVHLIKELRQNGISVTILPNDLRPVDYLFRKGHQSGLDYILPLILNIWQELPKEIILSIISNWYIKNFFKGDESAEIPKSIKENIIYVENFNGNIYNLNGDPISPQHMSSKLESVENIQKSYQQSFLQKSKYDDLPTPIYREHSPKIVGWAKMSLDNIGIHIDKSIITDEGAWNDVKSKKLRGFSVAGIATKSICNICSSDYVLCDHISGQLYNNQECFNTITKALLAECSLVETPAYSDCLVEIITNQINLS